MTPVATLLLKLASTLAVLALLSLALFPEPLEGSSLETWPTARALLFFFTPVLMALSALAFIWRI